MIRLFGKLKKHRNNKGEKLPDKCSLCGLRVSYSQNTEKIDSMLSDVGKLYHRGIVNIIFVRKMNVSVGGDGRNDITYYCALSNRRYWHKPNNSCPDWQFKGSARLSLSDHLAIHHTIVNNRIAKIVGFTGVMFAIFNIAIAFFL